MANNSEHTAKGDGKTDKPDTVKAKELRVEWNEPFAEKHPLHDLFYVTRDVYDYNKDKGTDLDIVLDSGRCGDTYYVRLSRDEVDEHKQLKTGDNVVVTSVKTRRRERFDACLRDLSVISSLRHENVVKFLAYTLKKEGGFVEDVRPIFEYMTCSLAQVLYVECEDFVKDSSAGFLEMLGEDSCRIGVARDVAGALKYLHAKQDTSRDGAPYVHGDVRPTRIMLRRGENRLIAKVKIVLQHVTVETWKYWQVQLPQNLGKDHQRYRSYNTEDFDRADMYLHKNIREEFFERSKSFAKDFSYEQYTDAYAYGVTMNEMCSRKRPTDPYEASADLGDTMSRAVERCVSVTKGSFDNSDAFWDRIIEILSVVAVPQDAKNETIDTQQSERVTGEPTETHQAEQLPSDSTDTEQS